MRRKALSTLFECRPPDRSSRNAACVVVVDAAGTARTFESSGKAIAYASQHGGLLAPQNSESELRFTCWRAKDRESSQGVIDARYDSVGLFFTQRELENGQRSTHQVSKMFDVLCAIPQTVFAYLRDDQSAETLPEWQRIDEVLAKGKPPNALYWWNYFSESIDLSVFDWNTLRDLHPEILSTDQRIVRFAASPWNVPTSRLAAINSIWPERDKAQPPHP